MKKWLICGSRDAPANLSKYVSDVLDRIIILEGRPAAICHGAQRGIDTLAETWAKDRRVAAVPFAAEWKKLGDKAGPIRNQKMIRDFQPDLVLAFPGDKGTNGMVKLAKDAGIRVIRIPSPESLGYSGNPGSQQRRAA